MNTLTNPNSSSITFYCPNYLKNTFDELVKFKRLSRTSIINYLMEEYVRKEHKSLKEDNQLSKLINDVKLRNHKNKYPSKVDISTKPTQWSVQKKSDDYEPPMIPSVNDWEDDLLKL